MEQENKKKKIIVAIIGVLVLLVVVGSATYAFFSATDTEEVKQITTAKTELIVETPEEATHITNIKPTTWDDTEEKYKTNSDIVQIPITVTNKSTIDVKYFLRLSSNDLKLNEGNDATGQPLTGGSLSDVKYVLYDVTSGAKVTNPVTKGDFATPEVEQTIVNKKEIGKLNSEDNKPNIHNYILYVYIEEIGSNQNKLQGIDFTINIKGDTRAPEKLPLSEAILENETPITIDPVFSETSKDRGLYEMKTDKGKIYYYRGSEKVEDTVKQDESYKPDYVMNNYVSFGTHTKDVTNKVLNDSSQIDEKVAQAGDPIIWRIVRINEDRSVTLIAENNIGDSWNVLNTKGKIDYVNPDDSSPSEIKQTVDNWYRDTFENPTAKYEKNKKLDSLVKVTEFCNDRSGDYYSAVFSRLYQNKPPKPTLKCTNSNDIVEAKAGLITADELVYAGTLYDKKVTNNTTYLNNNTMFWTISPTSPTTAVEWNPNYPKLDYGYASDSYRAAARPVITLSSEASVKAGSGASSNPFVIR